MTCLLSCQPVFSSRSVAALVSSSPAFSTMPAGAMGIGFMGEPQIGAEYPVINPDPTFFAVQRNWSFSDYFRLGGWTAFGAAYGFATGKPARRSGFYWMGGVAFIVVAAANYNQSYLKLTGRRPNQKECESWGVPYVTTNPYELP